MTGGASASWPRCCRSPVVVNLIDGPSGPLTVTAAVATLHQRYDAVHAGVARIDDAWLNVLPQGRGGS